MQSDLEGERLFAAKVTLAHFDGKNEVSQLAKMLADQQLKKQYGREVVRRLAMCSDPRAIPCFVEIIKTDSDPYIIDMAIQALSESKHKAAVQGLIECFDVKFKSQNFGKGERATPEGYYNSIAHSLQRITGQPFGGNKQQWLRWWRDKGQQDARLK